MSTARHKLIVRWRDDPGGTYKTWFLWEERLKNFRSIRRGIQIVVEEIENGSFGNAYRGSSLETVVHSIAEQRQMFKGADHAWLWKPKLRIPDIYESSENQRAFGRFLDTCVCCQAEEQLLGAVRTLDGKGIKGLGPASANLLYFLHPTLIAPFNTSIVRGYNALTGAKVKLGSFREYLAMRQGLLRINAEHRALLSNDLGAIAGLLFDIGAGRYAAPPLDDDPSREASWAADLEKVRQEGERQRKQHAAEREGDLTHTQVQGWLRDLGKGLGFEVWVAQNDRGRAYEDGKLGDGCREVLPLSLTEAPGADAIKLIDILWLEKTSERVAAAFEVEHTTSIYSGIVRLLDLALGAPEQAVRGLYLVAPDAREADVMAQVARPAFRGVADKGMRFLPYSELEKNRHHMARFGEGLRAVEAVARRLVADA
jgi:type II restriction enzyme